MPPHHPEEQFLAQARDFMLAWVRRKYPRLEQESAEDAVQDAFQRYWMYERTAEIRNRMACLMHMLGCTANNEWVRQAQRMKREVHAHLDAEGRLIDPLDSIPAPTPSHFDPEFVLESEIVPWIKRHRPDDLEIFQCRRRGVEWAEIAGQLGLPRNTAIKRGSRLLATLKRHFSMFPWDEGYDGGLDEGGLS